MTDLKFQGELNWRPFQGLDLTALGSYRYQRSTSEHFVKDNSNQANAYRAGIIPEDATIRDANKYLYTNPDDPNALPETILPRAVYTSTTHTLSRSSTSDSTLSTTLPSTATTSSTPW